MTPDMTTMAKIIAGGLPGGCVAGQAAIIDQIAIREGESRNDGAHRVAHPGTFNANPLSATAGATCLELIADGEHQRRAAESAAAIARGLNALFVEASVPGGVYGFSSMLHIAIGMPEQPPDGYSWGWRALPCPAPRVAQEVAQALRLGMLNEGVDLMGASMMVSSAHTSDDVDQTVAAFRATLRAMKDDGVFA
jgi:glutamate-1-semialdehyde 2,1-aminomutase